MSQGGVAGFSNGGMFSSNRPGIGMGVRVDRGKHRLTGQQLGFEYINPADPDVSYSRRAGEIRFPSTTVGDSSRDISSSQALYDSQFPYSAELEESFLNMALPIRDQGSMWTESVTGGPASPIETAAGAIPGLISNMVRGLSQVTRQGAAALEAGTQWLVQKQDNDALSFNKLIELGKMTRRQPDHVDEIVAISNDIMGTEIGQNMDAEEYKLAVSDELYKRNFERTSGMQGIPDEYGPGSYVPPESVVTEYDPGGGGNRMAYGPPPEGVSLRPFMPTVSEGLQADSEALKSLEPRMEVLREDMPGFREDLEAYSSVMGDPAAQQKFISNLAEQKGQDYVSMLLANVDELAGEESVAIARPEEPEEISAEIPAKKKVVEVPDVVIEGPPVIGQPTEDPSAQAQSDLDAANAVKVENLATPTEKPTIYNRKELIEKLQQDETGVDPDAQWAGLADVLKQIGQKSEGTGTVDIETLKAEIDALLPKVEEDQSMAGLHTIMLGAAIAGGTSSNPWTNIANGVAQQLPNIIEYRASLTEAKRARETAVAKLAIEQKLGIEAEGRAESRAIAAEQRGLAIDISKTLFEKSIEEEQYSVAMPTYVDASTINPDATGKVLIPALTPFSLTNDQLDFFSDNNIPLIRTDKLTASDISDMLGQAESSFTPDEWNDMVKTETGIKIFGNFLEGAEYTAYIPKPGAKELLSGDPSLDRWTRRWVDDQTIFQVQGYYDEAIKTHRDLWGELEELKTYATVGGNLTGGGRLYEALGSAMQGWAAAPDSPFAQVANYILGGKDLADYDAFEAKGRMILTKIAPLLLGESGKTISDTDRIMVAKAIGMNIWQNEQGVWQLTAKNPFTDVLKDPGAIENAIAETQAALGRAVEAANMEMATFYITNGRRVPEKELLQYQAPEQFQEAIFMDLREG